MAIEKRHANYFPTRDVAALELLVPQPLDVILPTIIQTSPAHILSLTIT